LKCWCVDALMSWCVDVLMTLCWCVDVLMRWCVDVLMWCVDALMCWCVEVWVLPVLPNRVFCGNVYPVSTPWRVEKMCWYGETSQSASHHTRSHLTLHHEFITCITTDEQVMRWFRERISSCEHLKVLLRKFIITLQHVISKESHHSRNTLMNSLLMSFQIIFCFQRVSAGSISRKRNLFFLQTIKCFRKTRKKQTSSHHPRNHPIIVHKIAQNSRSIYRSRTHHTFRKQVQRGTVLTVQSSKVSKVLKVLRSHGSVIKSFKSSKSPILTVQSSKVSKVLKVLHSHWSHIQSFKSSKSPSLSQFIIKSFKSSKCPSFSPFSHQKFQKF